MNRPLALIEGDLALPIARPFDTLPPPFGARRRPSQAAAQREPQREPQPARTGAQQAIQNAVERREPAPRRGPFPPGVKFLLFYKLPQQRDHSRRFDEQLAEARHYLERGRARPRSTRADHLLGAAIFAGCSIALAWLVIATTARDTASETGAAMAKALTRTVAIHSPVDLVGTVAQRKVSPSNATPTAVVSREPAPANATPRVVASGAPTRTNANSGSTLGNPPMSAPQRVDHFAPNSTPRASTHQTKPGRPAQPDYPAPIARLSKTQVDARLALSRTTHAATQPFATKSAEWIARLPSASETAERTALLDWATQQRRAAITTHAGLPTPADADWNARMIQRRVTDNPDAFQTDGGAK